MTMFCHSFIAYFFVFYLLSAVNEALVCVSSDSITELLALLNRRSTDCPLVAEYTEVVCYCTRIILGIYIVATILECKGIYVLACKAEFSNS